MMMTDTTTASRIDAPVAGAPTLLTDDEIDAVSGGGLLSVLIDVADLLISRIPPMRM
jgi:hypothetical protein